MRAAPSAVDRTVIHAARLGAIELRSPPVCAERRYCEGIRRRNDGAIVKTYTGDQDMVIQRYS